MARDNADFCFPRMLKVMQEMNVDELEALLLTETDSHRRLSALLALRNNIYEVAYIRCVELCTEAIEIAQELGEQKQLISAHLGLAKALWKLGENLEAQKNYVKVVELCKEIGDDARMAEAYGGLGIAHATLKDTANAIAFFEKASVLARRVNDKLLLAHTMGNLGQSYAMVEAYYVAMEYYDRALEIAYELGEDGQQTVANMCGAMANILSLQGKTNEAIAKLEEGVGIHREIGNLRGVTTHLMNMGETYIRSRQYAHALPYLNMARSHAEQLEFRVLMIEIHRCFSEVYSAIGEEEEALWHITRLNELRTLEKRAELQRGARSLIKDPLVGSRSEPQRGRSAA